VSLFGSLKGLGPTGFGYRTTADEVLAGLNLSDKTFAVTGCSAGLGRETVRALVARGATVIALARSSRVTEIAPVRTTTQLIAESCDLANPASIRECAARVLARGIKIDGLICNAGVMAIPRLQQAYGYELQFFTNHIGHFILVGALLPALADTGRVVVLSSAAHRGAPSGGIDFDNLSGERGYNAVRAYAQSKMANLLFAKELARSFQGTTRSAVALHPGIIMGTNLIRHFPVPRIIKSLSQSFFTATFLKSIEEGAATTCFAAAHPRAIGLSGAYLADCNIARPRPDAEDADLARRLWKVSAEIAASV
jgi:WW domain-containing oxidoreductase